MPPVNHKEKETITEQFYSQVSDSIKSVFDLTSRIDERVKMLVERQNDVEERLDKFLEIQQNLFNRISILETKDINSVKTDVTELSKKVAIIELQEYQIEELKEMVTKLNNKVESLEIRSENLNMKDSHHEKRWQTIMEYGFKSVFVVLMGFILYKLGLQKP